MMAAPAPSGTDMYRPYLLVGHALAVLMIVVIGVELLRNFAEPTSRDFISFWGAGKLVLAGTPELAYDRAVLHALHVRSAAFEPAAQLPFAYTPAFLLPVLPFALLTYPVAMALWTFSTLAIYALVARRLAPRSRWLAVSFPPVFAIAAIGQNGFVTAALFLGGLVLMRSGRKFAAGLVLGCLIVKPQLALMLPVAMLAGREWRVIAGGAVSAGAVLLIGFAAFGSDTFAAWLAQMPLFAEIAKEGLVGWNKLVSVYAALRHAGAPEPLAMLVHCAIAIVAAGLVARTWHSSARFGEKAAVLAAATMLASPYLYLYDALVLVPAFAWLVERRTPPAWVACLWLLPLLVIAQTAFDIIPVNLAPVLPIALLVLCHRRPTGEGTLAENEADDRGVGGLLTGRGA
jgi:hypothetical protein